MFFFYIKASKLILDDVEDFGVGRFSKSTMSFTPCWNNEDFFMRWCTKENIHIAHLETCEGGPGTRNTFGTWSKSRTPRRQQNGCLTSGWISFLQTRQQLLPSMMFVVISTVGMCLNTMHAFQHTDLRGKLLLSMKIWAWGALFNREAFGQPKACVDWVSLHIMVHSGVSPQICRQSQQGIFLPHYLHYNPSHNNQTYVNN